MSRAALAAGLLATLIGVGCGRAERTPAAVAEQYFRALGRDPLRTLPITSDAFHRSHGLQLAARSGSGADEQRVAWLAIQSRPELARLVGSSTRSVRSASEAGDGATVVVQVEPAAAPAFEQVFTLARGADGGWRIDAIEQRGVDDANRLAAFASYPNEAARRMLARAPAR